MAAINWIDVALIAILAVTTLFGLYRGFIAAILGTGSSLIAFGGAMYFSPKLVAIVQGNTSLRDTLSYYTDVSSRLGDLDTAISDVRTLTAEKITEIVSRVQLPEPLAKLLENNLSQQVYASERFSTVQEYISQTILSACINVLCFAVCFAVLLAALLLIVALLKFVFRFPVLKQLDSLAGGVCGLLVGALICFVLMALFPMVQTMLPMQELTDMVAQSKLAMFFMKDNLILAIMNGSVG